MASVRVISAGLVGWGHLTLLLLLSLFLLLLRVDTFSLEQQGHCCKQCTTFLFFMKVNLQEDISHNSMSVMRSFVTFSITSKVKNKNKCVHKHFFAHGSFFPHVFEYTDTDDGDVTALWLRPSVLLSLSSQLNTAPFGNIRNSS